MIIDQLPLLASAQATDEIPIERGVTTYKTALSTMLDVAKSTATPPKDGTAAVGSSDKFARQDHRHPLNVATSGTPKMDGTASLGSATDYARTDHVHPTDTSRQETLVSGTNIKTINNNSLLGSGDITIGGAVDSVNGQTGTVVLDADDVGAMSKWELLWENASISSQFPAQDVTLNITDYTFFLIVMRNSQESNTDNAYSCQIISKLSTNATNCARLFAWAADNQPLYRGYYFNANGIHFNRSYYGVGGSGQGSNSYCTPYRIFGIKGVVMT